MCCWLWVNQTILDLEGLRQLVLLASLQYVSLSSLYQAIEWPLDLSYRLSLLRCQWSSLEIVVFQKDNVSLLVLWSKVSLQKYHVFRPSFCCNIKERHASPRVTLSSSFYRHHLLSRDFFEDDKKYRNLQRNARTKVAYSNKNYFVGTMKHGL